MYLPIQLGDDTPPLDADSPGHRVSCMRTATPPSCAACAERDHRIANLTATVQELNQTILALQQQLAQAAKTSATSSKPPSSDIVKPPKPSPPDGQAKRTIGGQPGHQAHFRQPFPPDQVHSTELYRLDSCPDCGHSLQPNAEPSQVIQQIDLHAHTCQVTEHRSYQSWCPQCGKMIAAPFPSAVAKGGLLGPRLTALVAYMKGACHASFSTIRLYFRDVLRVQVSRGHLKNVLAKVTAVLDTPYDELKKLLPDEKILNVDETGHKKNGEHWWTWCFRAELYTLFHIDPHRSSAVLIEVLGREFAGVIGCDLYSSYQKYMREFDVVLQLCLAHWIRDIKHLTTLPNAAEREYGERLRESVRDLFRIIHAREQHSEVEYQRRLQAQRRKVVVVGTSGVPEGESSQTMKKRLEKHGQAYFTFITTPGVEPTNNLAEQAIRFVVIDRRITQGTRSEDGDHWCERIWTVLATCAQRGVSAWQFLEESIMAYWEGVKQPSLLGT